MKNSKNPCGNYEVQFKNDICIIRGITYLGYLALTCFAYDSDIRIPCVVVEKTRNGKMHDIRAEVYPSVY